MKFLTFTILLSAAIHAAQPYNVLVVMLDDWGVDFSSQNTHPDAVLPSMPEMDTLASTGVTFTEFRTSAQCAQTRASFLTGRYPYLTTVDYVGQTLPAGEFTIADDLSDNHSYETAMFGKWNLGGGTLETQDYPRTLGGFDHFSGPYVVGGFQTLHYATNKTTNGAAPVANAADEYITTDQADDAIAWIGTATEPWFVHLCFNTPHFASGGTYPYPPTALQRNFTGTPGANGGVNGYLSALEALDTEIGRVFDACDLDQTVILVFGDNGSPFVNPPVPDSSRLKGTNYDNGVRSPLVIHCPGTVNPGRQSSVFCNVVDLYPTIMKLATGSAHASPNPLSGQDISGVMRGEVVPLRIQWDSDNQDTINPTITSDGTYRLYDFIDSTPDEFYHIAADPYEQTNLGTSGLTGPAAKAYNNLRYALTTFTNKTAEQTVVVAEYTSPSITTGGVAVASGGITVIRPSITTPATITAPLKTGATTYTLWKKVGDFGTWTDSGLTPAIGAAVVFTDPTPTGRTYYRITNNAPEP